MTKIVAAIFLGVCVQVAWSQGDFDQMHITWAPPDAENVNAFKEIPLTPNDAISKGYKELVSKSNVLDADICRYIKEDNDPSNILLFRGDKFCGIQSQFPLSKINNPESKWMNWFEDDLFSTEQRDGDTFYTLTAITRPSGSECDKNVGCSLSLVKNDGSLWDMPTTMPEDDPNGWVRAKCVPGMGRHYLWKIGKDMDCMKFRPFFLMYKDQDKTLNGWGFQAQANSSAASPQYESPPRDASGFFDKVPDCLGPLWDETRGISTIHFYINADPSDYQCDPDLKP